MKDGHCATMNPVYKVTCNICEQTYCGESSRSGHDRFSEHLRYANNPTAKSYQNEALAEHYRLRHQNMSANLTFEILTTSAGTIRRKILESYYINKLKPAINNKEECKDVERYLV